MASKTDALEAIGNELVEQIKQVAASVGEQISDDATAVAEYASARADHLSLAVGEAGFQHALIAERDNVVLFAAVRNAASADEFDGKILAVVQGGLATAARALAVIAAA